MSIFMTKHQKYIKVKLTKDKQIHVSRELYLEQSQTGNW